MKEYRVVLKHGITGEPWEQPIGRDDLPADTFDWTTSLHVAQLRAQKIMNGTHARSMYADVETREKASEVTEISEGSQRRVGYKTITSDTAIWLDIEVNKFLHWREAATIRSVTPTVLPAAENRQAVYMATIVYEYDESEESK